MLIINQDGDERFNLSTKDIIISSHTVNGLFFGWNMYGRTKSGKVLLGTFETPEFCNMVLERMHRAETQKEEYYIIPEEPDEDDGMFDWHNAGSMWMWMELAVDYTALPRIPDQREVEPFGRAVPVELIIHESPLLSGMD